MRLEDVEVELTAIADELHRKISNVRHDTRAGSVRATLAYRYGTHLVEDLRDRVRLEVRS